MKTLVVSIFFNMLLYLDVSCCTSMIVTPQASLDGSSIVTYLADSHLGYGELYYWPAQDNPQGTLRDIYDWDTKKYLGKISEIAHTYQVVGNMNEHQLAIAESTFDGRKELQDTTGILDYGSLIYITLQRATTARQAIDVMTSLVEQYGYYSTGETFSIADPNEAWMMEMIGKGIGNKGALWVALRIPEGYLTAHANQSRIRTFPLKDKKNCLYSKDVITFAKSKNYFNGKDKDFSFADAYDPIEFSGIRFCEARVWSIFRRIAPSMHFSEDYVNGKNKGLRLPLWIKPDKPISVKDAMVLMRDHFEGTSLDLSNGVGAGPYHLPYRNRPLIWKYNNTEYFNDRSISTQQTCFSFISQSRKDMPDPIGGVLWFGVDDSYFTAYTPFYCCIKQIPNSYRQGNGDLLHYSADAAFWVFNRVSNFAWLRYSDMIKDIQQVQSSIEDTLLTKQSDMEELALALYDQNPDKGVNYLTLYSLNNADRVIARWSRLFEDLLVKYLDGVIKTQPGIFSQPGYPDDWNERIIKESGERYKVPD